MIQVKRNHIRAGLICTGLVRAVSIDTLSLLSLETGSGSQSIILVRISISFIIGDDRATKVKRRGRLAGHKGGESFEAWSTAQHANVSRR